MLEHLNRFVQYEFFENYGEPVDILTVRQHYMFSFKCGYFNSFSSSYMFSFKCRTRDNRRYSLMVEQESSKFLVWVQVLLPSRV
jgi:hypothetical protein